MGQGHPPKDPHLRHLLVGICKADGAVVAHPGYPAATVGETDAMDPATAAARLKHELAKRHLGPPGGRHGTFLDLLDVGRKNPIWRGKRKGMKPVLKKLHALNSPVPNQSMLTCI